MAGSFKWYGPQRRRDARALVNKRLRKIAAMVESQVRINISETSRGEAGRDAHGRFTKGVHGPSLPGEYPHADTGTLRKSVTSFVDEAHMVAYIGTNVEYAPYLEYGTEYMAAREFLRRTVREMESQIRNVAEYG